jgi:hypothetical protein
MAASIGLNQGNSTQVEHVAAQPAPHDVTEQNLSTARKETDQSVR